MSHDFLPNKSLKPRPHDLQWHDRYMSRENCAGYQKAGKALENTVHWSFETKLPLNHTWSPVWLVLILIRSLIGSPI